MLTRVKSEPFEFLCADFVGPLPRSKLGNTMLLVFHDIFSKLVELIPLRNRHPSSEGIPGYWAESAPLGSSYCPHSNTHKLYREDESDCQDDDSPTHRGRPKFLGRATTGNSARHQHKRIGLYEIQSRLPNARTRTQTPYYVIRRGHPWIGDDT